MNNLHNKKKVTEHKGLNIYYLNTIYLIELKDGSFKACDSVRTAIRVIEDFNLHQRI